MTTKFKGIAIQFGDTSLVVPPLNFRALQSLQSRLAGFSGGTDPDSIQVVVDAFHSAVVRNYPDMTVDQVVDLLDLENMQAVMEAVMDVSGLRRKAMEATTTATDPSTGLMSTPS